MSTEPSAPFRFPDLNGRRLLITGITRGIGRALLPGLLEQGLELVAVSRNLEKMEAIRSELGASEAQLRLYDCDLGDREAVAATAQEIAGAGLEIDAVLHNAAIDPRHWFGKNDDAFWHEVMQINFFSAITLTRALLPVIRRSDQGRILFTGSVLFDMGGACVSAYTASKGAILGVTRSLAHELKGSGVTVNCIIPGAIRVEKETGGNDDNLINWQSVPRRLEPDDLLGATCLLLSRWGGGITGQAITIDGGIVHPLAAPEQQGKRLGPL
ncbi:MAG TPA: SDR family NAD(P)-dependent oxidoreductase [Chthoniobacteraceae bacterium]|nr:SDR family NAD(P)-dependent oxidoreductase [Chthoniobacteraceae bacterium]